MIHSMCFHVCFCSIFCFANEVRRYNITGVFMKKCSILILIMLSIITPVSARDFAAAEKAGFRFSADNKTLLRCPQRITTAVIPAGVTTIGDSAFAYCYDLTRVTIPNSVTAIGHLAFYNCRSLTGVTIPARVTSIGHNAFAHCKNLTKITIPDRVTTIGEKVFLGCINLTGVTLPARVTDIGDWAFYDCKSLTKVTIPARVTSIGCNAFARCKRLTKVTIPDCVTSIGEDAFDNCEQLKEVSISANTKVEPSSFPSTCKITIRNEASALPENNFTAANAVKRKRSNDNKTAQNGGASEATPSKRPAKKAAQATDFKFSADNKTLLHCPQRITTAVVPSGVTTIGDSAFAHCFNLTRVTIPDSVTSIGKNAFVGCRKLTSVMITDSVTLLFTHFQSFTLRSRMFLPWAWAIRFTISQVLTYSSF